MATIATITEQDPQANNKLRCYFRYTHDGGAIGNRGPMWLDDTADIQAIADSFIAKYDEAFKEKEYTQALLKFFNGEDMDDVFDSGFFKILTRNDMRRKCLRRAANRMIKDNDAALEDLAMCSVWVNTLTNATVAQRLTNNISTWTNAEAGAFKDDLAALAASHAALDHGKGKQDEG